MKILINWSFKAISIFFFWQQHRKLYLNLSYLKCKYTFRENYRLSYRLNSETENKPSYAFPCKNIVNNIENVFTEAYSSFTLLYLYIHGYSSMVYWIDVALQHIWRRRQYSTPYFICIYVYVLLLAHQELPSRRRFGVSLLLTLNKYDTLV